ncbi:4-hydroxythreonine-4-phosphate dehydrogenase PdxA [Cohaesibacter intestini]|uniref:4-hydroxythreonine-4-phosphate dehydrogenase PdxA n=1 Tax=Cohaesibacter intestini TaxID=2211145 RepID=UPI000DE87201|nr:4-hydroxythreonine-4-phosphate dehydrogenase PdxA [Cohaesibacter intestini]
MSAFPMPLSKLAITMGDPSGVGPEVILKAFHDLPAEKRARLLVIGDMAVLKRAAAACDFEPRFHPYGTDPEEAGESLEVYDIPLEGLPDRFGVLSDLCGEACYQYIAKGVELAQSGAIKGIVTAPINKAALNAAGHHFDGHTGMLAHLTQSKSSFMLLADPKLKVIHASTHVSLRDAIERATPERILATIEAGDRHLKRLGYDKPKIGVAGLNPHCGEGGLFGDEDDRNIRPGIEMAQAKGIDVVGPIPADTAYYRAAQGEFDLMVAQYHDQGHIPIKLIAFDSAVNVSLGLPIDRVSVDHGTAFDIAGKGLAKHENMICAITYGLRLADAPA